MKAWLSVHLHAIVSGSALLAVGGYLAKKFADKVIDALPGWPTWRARRRLVTDCAKFYRGEMVMHSHAFVPRQMIDTARDRPNSIEDLSKWMRDTKTVLILYGERGIGKSRLCIEFAKNENNKHRSYFMQRDVVRWINIKEYSKPASDYCKAVEPLIKKGTTYVYDSYPDSGAFLGSVADLVRRKKGKLLVVSPDPEGPVKALASTEIQFDLPLDLTPGTMGRDDLHEVVKSRAAEVGAEIDDVTMEKITSIATGLPGVAVLCVERVKKKGRLEGIDTLDGLYYSIWNDLEKQLQVDWSKIRPLLRKMVLLRGIPEDTIRDYVAAIEDALSAGRLVIKNGYVCIEPDTLNDWMVNKAFFDHGKRSLEFEFVLDEAVKTRPVEALLTLINLGKRGEAARLLQKAADRDSRTIIDLVLACESLKAIDLAEKNLGRFWEHVEWINDPHLKNRVASVLSTLGKSKEAQVCWTKAAELYETANNFWGVAQAQANTAAMYLRLNNWDEADRFYRLAIEAAAKVQGELAQWGMGRLHNSIGLVYANRGEWDKAVREQFLARRIYEQLSNDLGLRGIGETELILGSYYTLLGELEQAHSSYESARQSMEKSRDRSGLARAYSLLSLVCADKGDWKAAQDWDRKALNLLEELGDSGSISEVYKNFANLYHRQGDYKQAIRCYTLARERMERLGDAVGVAEIDMLFGWIYERQGNRVRAVEQFQRSAEVFSSLGDVRSHAYCELGLGNVYYNRGDRDAAQQHYEISETEFRRIQDQRGKALVAVNFGALCQEKALWLKAAEYYDKAIEIFDRVHDRLAVATTLLRIGRLRQVGYGDLDGALRLCRRALEITQQLGAFRESMESYTQIASVYIAQGRADAALQLYTDAFNGFHALGCRLEAAKIQLRISSIHQAREQLETAKELCKSALEIGKEIENSDLIADATSELAWLHERQADWATAARLFEDALGVFRTIGAPLAAAEASRGLGWIHYRRGNLDAAEKCCDESEKILIGIQYRPGLATVYDLRAHVAAQKENFEKAFEFYGLAERIWTDLSDLASLAALYNNKALAKQKAGQVDEAIRLCNQSLPLSLKLNDKRLESYSETILGMCYRDQRHWEKAKEHFERGIEIKRKLGDKYGLAYSEAEVGIMDRERDRLEEAEESLTKAFKSFLLLGCEGDARGVAQEIHQLANRFRARGDEGRAHRLEEVLASVSFGGTPVHND
jgi:tetratricopeptide (TPR) repeat protein